MSNQYEGYEAITEAGWAGNLNIEDPSSKKVKKKEKTIDELIMEAQQRNIESLNSIK